MDSQIVDMILNDLREVKSDIKLLLADKNKRFGIQIAASFFFSLFFALMIALIERN